MNEWSAVNKLSGHRNLLTKAEHILDLSNLSGTRSPGQDKSPWIVDLWDEQTFPGCFHCWENQQRLDIITFFKNRRNAEPRKENHVEMKKPHFEVNRWHSMDLQNRTVPMSNTSTWSSKPSPMRWWWVVWHYFFLSTTGLSLFVNVSHSGGFVTSSAWRHFPLGWLGDHFQQHCWDLRTFIFTDFCIQQEYI